MTPEDLAILRNCCRDESAFETLKQFFTTRSQQQLEQMRVQSAQLLKSAERERSIVRVIGKLGQSILDRVSQSLSFEDTLRATIQEIRHFLNADRVVVYRFNPDWSGEFISESVAEGWPSLMQAQLDDPSLNQNISDCQIKQLEVARADFSDTYLQEMQGGRFRDRESFCVTDIDQVGFSGCYRDLLRRYEVRSYAIAPIFVGETLWGLLAAYQNARPRDWQVSEVSLLTQVGTQLGAALQLAESLQEQRLQAEQQQILAHLVDSIRQSLDVNSILNATTQAVRHLLQADRVAVYRFSPDWSGDFVAESVGEEWVRLVGPEIHKVYEDTYLQQTRGGRYRDRETFAVDNVYTVGHMPCHLALLEQFQAKAYAIAPIFVGETLWGLLAAYQNAQPRQWQATEVELLAQVGAQFGVAVQQAELLAKLQAEVVERRQAEQSVRQLNWELRQSIQRLKAVNQELEAFSYSVSHDLRAPLRSMDGFSQALLEDYSHQLDETGQDYLRRVRAATQRMGELIDDLLDLSRVMRSEMRWETVDLSKLAHAIAAELQQGSPQRQGEFVIQDGLIAHGDPRLLRVLLMNLLDNAWKFTSKQPYAQIKLSAATRDEGSKVYSVRDNGAGFDMAYSNKLFGTFQRLHSVKEFPGTGIGLATVQRIVHRHGGQVWAEGAVGQGATFYFTLPDGGVNA